MKSIRSHILDYFLVSLVSHLLFFLLITPTQSPAIHQHIESSTKISINISNHHLSSNPSKQIELKKNSSPPIKNVPTSTATRPKDTHRTPSNTPIQQDISAKSSTQIESFKEPTLLTPIAPQYPRKSRVQNEEGVVLLDVEFLATGLIGEISILRSSNFHSLDLAAIDSVKKVWFFPAKQGNETVTFRKKIQISFRLND